ncbi:GNAT family N-acetyltransferase [Carnobacterium sp.]|uniref:GNAT family N-acetyltransferase n=1 Tax=Carnobacterium sp. TaxID=48221 RepID=UPI003C767A42
MRIREWNKNESIPINLLLLADPSYSSIDECVRRGDCFIAEEEEEIIGIFILLPTRFRTIEIVNVAVVKERQGKGIGKELVKSAIEKARQAGYKTIEVGTGNSSLEQLALYQKCHFRMISVDSDFFTKAYTEEIYENGIQCRDMIRLSQDL